MSPPRIAWISTFNAAPASEAPIKVAPPSTVEKTRTGIPIHRIAQISI